ncbi:cytochrome P450 [Colletotrichum somersetense]|nr:cytochrome P450 [Colletotrichum somersetense]
MSNVINLITRAFCNIVGDPELMKMIVAELDALAEDESPSSSSNLVIDVDRIRSSCPLLVATWYELLRTIGDAPVTRGVYEDALFAGKYQLKKGSIVMTPIHLHNFDKAIWGNDADVFRPSRFLGEKGQPDKELVKHLNVFGLPGMHQCLGRYLALNMTLGLVAKTLLAFEIRPASGDELEAGVLPKHKETMLGLPAMRRDPEVTVKRREGVESVRVIFDHVQPGI